MPSIGRCSSQLIFAIAKRNASNSYFKKLNIKSPNIFGNYDPISIGSLPPLASSKTSRLPIPASIQRPEYASGSSSGTPYSPPSDIPLIKSVSDLQALRASGALAKKILQFAESLLKPGLTTEELDRLGI